MNGIDQQKNEAFSVATLFYTRLRKVISRVIDVMYLIENKEYAKYVLTLATKTNDADLLKYAERLSVLLELNAEQVQIEEPKVAIQEVELPTSEPTEEEIYRAQVSHHYIGALR